MAEGAVDLTSGLPDYLKREALQVFRLGYHRDDRMVRRLGIRADAAQDTAGIVGCRKNGVLEQARINVMRATEGRENAADFEEFERPKMNFFITAQRVRHRGPVAGE